MENSPVADFSILFVCTGNICRSPTAEGVMRRRLKQAGLAERVSIESAGTGGWHVGSPPSAFAVECARRRGYDLSPLRARQISRDDFARFDLLIAMDRSHHTEMLRQCPEGAADRLRLFLEFAPQFRTLDVPDPYYGDASEYERALDMIEAGTEGLLHEIRRRLG
jgi:protein-tyrosine phosphatase